MEGVRGGSNGQNRHPRASEGRREEEVMGVRRSTRGLAARLGAATAVRWGGERSEREEPRLAVGRMRWRHSIAAGLG